MSTSAAGESAQPGPQPSTPAAGEGLTTVYITTVLASAAADSAAAARPASAAAGRPAPRRLSVASWFFKDVSGGLLLAGVLTYGILRLAYEEFYKNFGVSLDELGIGYSQLLNQGATGFAALLLFSLIAVGVSISIWSALISTVWARMASSRTLNGLLGFLMRPSRQWVWALSGIALFIWGPVWLRVILFLLLAICGLVPVLRRTYASGSSSSRAVAADVPSSRRLTVAILATTVIAVLGAGVILIAAAHEDAAMIKKGQEPVSGLPISISSWGARAAILIPLTPAAEKAYASVAGHRLMYLGASQDQFVLFDVDKQRTVRIPSRDLVVSTEP